MRMAADLTSRLRARRWSPQATFAARLSGIERDLQAVMDRVPSSVEPSRPRDDTPGA
jgi:hypothetical protein